MKAIIEIQIKQMSVEKKISIQNNLFEILIIIEVIYLSFMR